MCGWRVVGWSIPSRWDMAIGWWQFVASRQIWNVIYCNLTSMDCYDSPQLHASPQLFKKTSMNLWVFFSTLFNWCKQGAPSSLAASLQKLMSARLAKAATPPRLQWWFKTSTCGHNPPLFKYTGFTAWIADPELLKELKKAVSYYSNWIYLWMLQNAG